MMSNDRDGMLVARYSLWLRLLVVGLSPIAVLVLIELPELFREPSFSSVARSLLVLTLWCAGFGEMFVRRTAFSKQALTRRSAWGTTARQSYSDVQELSVVGGKHLDIVFRDGSKWRIWAREAPLDLVREAILARVEAMRIGIGSMADGEG
jgi:hypothetical protein